MKASDIATKTTRKKTPPTRSSPTQGAKGADAPMSPQGAPGTGTLDPPGTPTTQAFPELDSQSIHVPGISKVKRTGRPRLPMASEDSRQISLPSLPTPSSPKETVSPADYGGVITSVPQPTIHGTDLLSGNVAQLRKKYGY